MNHLGQVRRLAAATALVAIAITGCSSTGGSADSTSDPSSGTTGTAMASDTFYFQATELATPRQGGNTIDIFVGVRYVEGTTAQEIPDYRRLLDLAKTYLEATDSLPAPTSWEVVARDMAPTIMAAGPISGATVQIRVHPLCEEPAEARGVWRSAIFTVGDIAPMEFVPGPVPACPADGRS